MEAAWGCFSALFGFSGQGKIGIAYNVLELQIMAAHQKRDQGLIYQPNKSNAAIWVGRLRWSGSAMVCYTLTTL